MILTNVTTSLALTPEDESKKATYADLIKLVVSLSPAREGVTFGEMRTNLAIIEKCDAGPEVLEFTDDEHAAIRAMLDKHRWPANHPELLAFNDAVSADGLPTARRELAHRAPTQT